MKSEFRKLNGMADEKTEALKAWDLEWRAFGPISSDTISLPENPDVDGMSKIPSELTIDGKIYKAKKCRSINGFLDLRKVFTKTKKFPAAFIFTKISSSSNKKIPVAFGADWTSLWWLNGKLVYEAASGNGVPPEDLSGNQFLLPLKKGENIMLIKIGSGFGGWNLNLFTAEAVAGVKGKLCSFPSGKKKYPKLNTRDYSATGLRLENRNSNEVPGKERWKFEKIGRKAGLESRWIQVVDSREKHAKLGSPFYQSEFLTPSPGSNAASKTRLKSWIKAIHDEGMPALSWYPMSFSYEAAQEDPSLRGKSLPGDKEEYTNSDFAHCCPNTAYGDKLINFTIEAIGELGLDGFWFDGGYFSPMGHLGCNCEGCQSKFKKQEGLDFPVKEDWNDPAFKTWVKWRFRTFSEFWGRLAGRVQRVHPHARIVINHMHRSGINWLKGCPLNPIEAPIVGGSESSSLEYTSVLHTRLLRAYGYNSESEIWMGLHGLHGNDAGPTHAPYVYHALSCMTSGGMPSFGTDATHDKNRETYEILGNVVNPRTKWTGGESVPHVALHVSQQSETLHFSRLVEKVSYIGYELSKYWNSILGWNNLLTETQCLTDVVFDDHLKPGCLSKYPVLVMPLSPALSDENIAVIEEYVSDGGVLVAGPWFGSSDEWGDPANPKRIKNLFGKAARSAKSIKSLDKFGGAVEIRGFGSGTVVKLEGDVGFKFNECHSRKLALEIAELIRELTPSPVILKDDPDIHIGLFRHPGHLVLHVQNTVAYSSAMNSFPNPLTLPPVLKKNVKIEVSGFPVKSVAMVAGESEIEPKLRVTRDKKATITLPELSWGCVLRLDL